MSSAQLGHRLIAEAQKRHHTRRTGYHTMRITTEDGQPDRQLQGTVQRLNRQVVENSPKK